MQLIVNKTRAFQGVVTLPGSKSHTVRALFLALLAQGTSFIHQALYSSDIQDAMNVCETLAAFINVFENSIHILSSGKLPTITYLYTGNSGLTTHFALPLMGLRLNAKIPVIVDCGHQMRTRPITSFLNSLSSLGLSIRYLSQEGKFPIEMQGRLTGGFVEVSGETSQYLSSLLFALPTADEDSIITVKNLRERPYLEMTLGWLKTQNILYSHEQSANLDKFFIPGKQDYKAFNASIPGDFSAAANIIAAAVLTDSQLIIQNVDWYDLQADKIIVTLLQEMGADISVLSDRVIVKGAKKLKGFPIDAESFPDLLPILAVVGTQTENGLHIRNVKHARFKETDRIHSMVEGLTKLGANIVEYEDGLSVFPSRLKGCEVNGYGDHRTVMALSIAGLVAEGVTTISDGEAIQKTFPEFIEKMQYLGVTLGLENEIVF